MMTIAKLIKLLQSVENLRLKRDDIRFMVYRRLGGVEVTAPVLGRRKLRGHVGST